MPAAERRDRRVVFHADDFGMNHAVNLGIIRSFRDGLLTSTAILANAPAAEAACEQWPRLVADHENGSLASSLARHERSEPPLPFDLGIHGNLTQGRPITGDRYPARLLDSQGPFPGIGALFVAMHRIDKSEFELVLAELRAQIEWMCDRGLRPTHLNGHQYIELLPRIAAAIPEMLRRYAIPVVRVAYESGLMCNVLMQGRISSWGIALVKRHYAALFRRRMHREGIAFPGQFFGTAHAGRINGAIARRFLDQFTQQGLTEIGVHPAEEAGSDNPAATDAWFDPLTSLRPLELNWLCDPSLPAEMKSRRIQLGRLQFSKRYDTAITNPNS